MDNQLILRPADVVAQARLIQDVMRDIMREGEHYGKIPGCGDKPSLFKGGAEKICVTFRLRPEYQIETIDMPKVDTDAMRFPYFGKARSKNLIGAGFVIGFKEEVSLGSGRNGRGNRSSVKYSGAYAFADVLSGAPNWSSADIAEYVLAHATPRDAAGAPRLTTLRFLLGTDSFGRDLLSRIAAGARVSLAIGLAGILGAALLAFLWRMVQRAWRNGGSNERAGD
jgi:hypothetical protein